jgi:hypothetical protein
MDEVYVPRVFSTANQDGVRTHSKSKFPSVKIDTVYRVDKRATWRKIDVCPCFGGESFFPQVVGLFDCLNANYGVRQHCAAQQQELDKAILADIRAKRAAAPEQPTHHQ